METLGLLFLRKNYDLLRRKGMYDYKEVYFNEYCDTCKYSDVDDVKDPCNECLGEPANLHSHKPVYYVADEKKNKS